MKSVVPGTPLTPTFSAARLALILSPITRIASDGGPMNVTPFSIICSANSAFSEKKPYPGWTASAPDFSIIARILGMSK